MPRLRLALLLLVSGLVVRADPAAEDLDAAIGAVLERLDFRWHANFERADDGRRAGFDGQSGRNDVTLATTAGANLIDREVAREGDRPVEIVYAGDRAVARVDTAWLTARETGATLAGRSTLGADVLGALPGIVAGRPTVTLPGSTTTVRDDQGRIHVPRPERILAALRNHLENVAMSGRALTADLAERGVDRLFATRLVVPGIDGGSIQTVVHRGTGTPPNLPAGVRGPTELVSYRGERGTATFWIVGGAVAKFELRLEGREYVRGDRAGVPYRATLVVTLDDIGATEVSAPPEALRRLGR